MNCGDGLYCTRQRRTHEESGSAACRPGNTTTLDARGKSLCTAVRLPKFQPKPAITQTARRGAAIGSSPCLARQRVNVVQRQRDVGEHPPQSRQEFSLDMQLTDDILRGLILKQLPRSQSLL